MKTNSLIPLCLALALAGCAAGPAPTSTWLVKGGSASNAASASDASAARSDVNNPDAVLAGNGSGAAAKPVGSKSSDTINITASAGNTAVKPVLVPVKGDGFKISAQTGGRYMSEDGMLTADIPPGALTRDAAIKIQRNDTSKQALSKAFVPGINFNVDLGGSSIAPGKSIIVSARVDDRFVGEMKALDPQFSPDKYNLKQDTHGDWMMSMAVNGPQLKPVERPAFANVNLRLIENGSLPVPGPLLTSAKHRRLLDAEASAAALTGAPSGVSSSADCNTWGNTIQSDVPSTIQNWRKQEGQGQFSCSTYDGNGWYMNIFHDLVQKRTTCGASGTPAPDASVAPLATADIPTHTTWDSDDPALAGKDADGADVRFDLQWSPNNGPTDVVADNAGLAKSFTLENLDFSATAYTNVGPAHGEAVNGTAKAGMGVIELKCPKFSPLLKLHISCDSPLPTKISLKYTLDGQETSMELPIPADSKSFDTQFYVIVPDDKDHEIKVTAVDAGAELGIIPPGPDTIAAHRNGQYDVPIKLQNIAAH